MFRRILVAADGSDLPAAAVRVGHLLAGRSGASLAVLRLVSRRASGVHGVADGGVRRQVTELGEAGLSVTERVASGPATRAIIAASQRKHTEVHDDDPNR